MACTCYNGCSSCGSSCGSGCSGTCDTGCSGCWGGCSGCSTTCTGGCSGGCSGCSGGCSGCSGCSGCGGECSSSCTGTDEGQIPPIGSGAYIAKYNSSISKNSIGAYIDGLDTAYSYSGRTIDWYLDDYYQSTMDLAGGVSGSNVKTFYGLQPDTTYKVHVVIKNIKITGGTTSKMLSPIYISTAGIPVTGNFSWSYAGYNSNDSLISGSEKMPSYGFCVKNSEWNALIDNVHSKLVARDMDTSAYPMTKVSKGDSFLAEYFNQVRYAIGSLASTGLSNKSRGDNIKASDLNLLMDRINTVK